MTGNPKRIFDAKRRARHGARAMRMTGDRFIWREAADGIADRLAPLAKQRSVALATEYKAAEYLHECADTWIVAGFDDDEQLAAEGTFDLIVSLMSLHGLNDLPGALAQIRTRLNTGGFFAAALFGGETLREMKESLAIGESEICGGAAMRVAPFADVRDLGGLMVRAGFSHPVADVERTVVRYRAFETLVEDLRLMGETGGLTDPRPLRRDALAAALAHYRTAHGEDGRLRATFDIVYLTGSAG
jgi:hypothetical protein